MHPGVANPQLVEYIRMQRLAGHAFEQLREAIIQRGWPIDDSDAALEAVRRMEALPQEEKPQEEKPATDAPSEAPGTTIPDFSFSADLPQESHFNWPEKPEESRQSQFMTAPAEPARTAFSPLSLPHPAPSDPPPQAGPAGDAGTTSAEPGHVGPISMEALEAPKAAALLEPIFKVEPAKAPQMPDAPAAPSFARLQHTRSMTVTILSALLIVCGALNLILAQLLLPAHLTPVDDWLGVATPSIADPAASGLPSAVRGALPYAQMVLGVLLIASSIGLLRLKHWAWLAALILAILGLATVLLPPFGVVPFVVSLAIIALLISKGVVREFRTYA